MAMTFYEKFKKYAPTDAERAILDHITAFTPKVDVENRYISVYADFDGLHTAAQVRRNRTEYPHSL